MSEISHGARLAAERSPQDKKKINYFQTLTTRYLPEMRLLLKGGKLVRRDNEHKKLSLGDRQRWINVTEHCLVAAAEAEELANALGLPDEDKIQLGKAAAIHDWDKRLSKKSREFTEIEKTEAGELLEKTGVDKELMSATDPSFSKRCLIDHEDTTLLQRLLYYIDTITEESEVVPFKPRLVKAKERWPELGQNDELNREISAVLGEGKGYWELVDEMSAQVQQEIFNLLRQRGVELQSPDEVPRFIKMQIEKNYGN